MKNEKIDLVTIKPIYDSEFDINKVLLNCHKTISNDDNQTFEENYECTKMHLWLLTHYIQDNLIPTKTLNPSLDYNFTSEEISMITSALRFNADAKCREVSQYEWCTKMYNLSTKIMNIFSENKSEKKGFVNLDKCTTDLMIEFGRHSSHHWIKDNIIKILQANGETPEEVNPVGQIFTKEEQTLLIKLVGKEINRKIQFVEPHDLERDLYNKLCRYKPLEATKEQSNLTGD